MDGLSTDVGVLNNRFKTITGGSFDDITESGMYYCYNVEGNWCFLQVIKAVVDGSNQIRQIRFKNDHANLYTRFYRQNTWSSWTEIALADDFVPKSGGSFTGNIAVEKTGESKLDLGNTTTGNTGALNIFANGSRYSHIVSSATGANRTNTLPNKDGTFAMLGDMPTGVLYISSASTHDGTTSVTYTGCPGAYRTPALLVGNANGTALLAVVMYSDNDFNIAAITGQSLTISATLVDGKWDITISGLAAWGNYKFIVFTED